MDKDAIIAALRKHEAEFRQLGVESLSLFGSTARGQSTERSDVDLAVKLDHDRMPTGFHYAGRLEKLRERLETALGCRVDVVPEPVRKRRFQEKIDRDRVLAISRRLADIVEYADCVALIWQAVLRLPRPRR